MAMIVIPKCGGSPEVVIFVTTLRVRRDKIGGKAIELRTSHTSVQVNDAGHSELVDVSNNRFSAAAGLDRWTWKCTVVSPDSGTCAGNNFTPRLLLGYLVVVGGGVCVQWGENLWNW